MGQHGVEGMIVGNGRVGIDGTHHALAVDNIGAGDGLLGKLIVKPRRGVYRQRETFLGPILVLCLYRLAARHMKHGHSILIFVVNLLQDGKLVTAVGTASIEECNHKHPPQQRR